MHFADRWMREADPDGQLSTNERRRRANALLREHLTRMAYLRSRKHRWAVACEADTPQLDTTTVKPDGGHR